MCSCVLVQGVWVLCVHLRRGGTSTHWAWERRHSSSSMMWLPMNQTRLEKYGAAVLLQIYSSMVGEPTEGEREGSAQSDTNKLTFGNQHLVCGSPL